MIQFIISVVNSCKTVEQLDSAAQWAHKIAGRYSNTVYNRASFMPLARALMNKREELVLKRS